MANEHLPNTRSIEVQWLQVVIKADPNWARDHRLQREFLDIRPTVVVDWQRRGPYAED